MSKTLLVIGVHSADFAWRAPATAVPPTTALTAKPAPAAIEVGASVPLTGKFGSLGTQVKPGYEYAVKDINAAGGVYVRV
jgi:ABC-type branched-subunit amino acid transport system substrate-binding protein